MRDSLVQNRYETPVGGIIASVDNIHIGSYGLVAAVLGYSLMVKLGNAYRRNDIFLMNPRDLTGCTMCFLALFMMIGGIIAFIYACVHH